ncbi:MAG: hypothetical protein J0I65_19070, partial [Variovorax sp.]|nr:hypothetical protein [Variovorax sp.]
APEDADHRDNGGLIIQAAHRYNDVSKMVHLQPNPAANAAVLLRLSQSMLAPMGVFSESRSIGPVSSCVPSEIGDHQAAHP